MTEVGFLLPSDHVPELPSGLKFRSREGFVDGRTGSVERDQELPLSLVVSQWLATDRSYAVVDPRSTLG